MRNSKYITNKPEQLNWFCAKVRKFGKIAFDDSRDSKQFFSPFVHPLFKGKPQNDETNPK